MSDTENLDLWNRRRETDPAQIKYVNQRGGFHTIDAQYQIRNATEEWGLYGTTWGVKNCVYIPLMVDGQCVEMAIEATFWYPGGEFQLSTEAAWRLNGDTRKKLLTDLTTKCLSKLGFNSDVFEGVFDGNKYIGANAPSKGEKITKDGDKAKLLAFVRGKRKDKHRAQLKDTGFIAAVSRQVIHKDIIDTVEECETVKQAIESGDFELGTGEKIPL